MDFLESQGKLLKNVNTSVKKCVIFYESQEFFYFVFAHTGKKQEIDETLENF